MWQLIRLLADLTAALLSSQFSSSQISPNLSPCTIQCINQSTYDSCNITNLKCICRESNGNFLPDLVLCMHGACDPSLDVSALLSSLSLICDSLGTPISQSALVNAEGVVSSVAAQSTFTVTDIDTATGSSVAPIRVGPQTSGPAGRERGVTIIQTAHTVSGGIQVIISSYSGSASIIVVGVNSEGSIYTSTTGSGGAGGAASVLKTITTTNSAGSTYTTTQSSTQSSAATSSGLNPSGGASSTASSSSSTSTSVSSTYSSSASQTSSATPSHVTNSARHEHAGSILGLTVLFVFVGLWL